MPASHYHQRQKSKLLCIVQPLLVFIWPVVQLVMHKEMVNILPVHLACTKVWAGGCQKPSERTKIMLTTSLGKGWLHEMHVSNQHKIQA